MYLYIERTSYKSVRKLAQELPGGLVVRGSWAFTAVAWVQSLAEEPKSCKPCSAAKKKSLKSKASCQEDMKKLSATQFVRKCQFSKNKVLFFTH